jgi:hypothetical protein
MADRYGWIQVSTVLNVREWQTRNDDARVADERALDRRLLKLENNHQRLRDALGKIGR